MSDEMVRAMEMEGKRTRTKPVALFMAFGTQGDVYPIAAIAAAFAYDQEDYKVVLISHSAHKNLIAFLAAKNVEYLPVSTPAVLAPYEDDDTEGTMQPKFSLQKQEITTQHRQECIYNVERIFGDGPSLEGRLEPSRTFLCPLYCRCSLRCPLQCPFII